MVSPHKLKYNGSEINEYLNTFDVILDVAFDSDNGAMSSFLNRSAVAAESHDGRYKNTHLYKYDELFSPQFTIVKKDFSDFNQSEVRQVLKYLTQTDQPALLEVSYDRDNEAMVDEDRDFCAIGGWTNIETYKIANSRTVGIIATFEAITPYALSPIDNVKISSETNYKTTINIDTDDNRPVYPYVTIQQKGASGDVTIINQHYYLPGKPSTPVVMTIKNNTSTEKIILDGANKIISSSNTRRIFGDDFVDWKWLELFDGTNEITVEGNCEVEIEYRTVRKIGEY